MSQTLQQTPAQTQGQEPILRIRGLGKRYGDHVVLKGIDFEVQPS